MIFFRWRASINGRIFEVWCVSKNYHLNHAALKIKNQKVSSNANATVVVIIKMSLARGFSSCCFHQTSTRRSRWNYRVIYFTHLISPSASFSLCFYVSSAFFFENHKNVFAVGWMDEEKEKKNFFHPECLIHDNKLFFPFGHIHTRKFEMDFLEITLENMS